MRWIHIAGLLAFLGVWFCFIVIGERVLKIESLAWGMVWGSFTLFVAGRVQAWIKRPSKNKGGSRGL